eukprot:s3212_g19.t1
MSAEAIQLMHLFLFMQFYVQEKKPNELEAKLRERFPDFSTPCFSVMGSTVETSPAVSGVEAGTPAVVLGAPHAPVAPVEGEMPATEAHLEVSGDQAKLSEGASPMTPKHEELTEEDAEAIRAAKRAKLESEEEKAEDLEKESIRKCLHHCQAALEYVARQQKSIQELQQQLLEIGAVAHHSESCQKYSLAEHFQRFAESLLQMQTQIADAYAAIRGAPAPAAPAPMPSFPPAPLTPTVAAPVAETPMTGYGTMPTAVAAAAMPAPPAPPMPARPRATVQLSLRMNDGTVQQRTASPTPYHVDHLRTNPGYAICGDGAYRRLL